MNTPHIFEIIFSTTVYWDHIVSTIGELALKVLSVIVSAIQDACLISTSAEFTYAGSILFNPSTGIFRFTSHIFTEDVTKTFPPAANI